MKRLSFCLAILLLLSFGVAFAQPPGNTFIRLNGVYVGTSSTPIANDTLFFGSATSIIRFAIMYGNRDQTTYNPSNGFRISSTDGATWAHAAPNGGNVKMATAPHNPQLMPGIWVDTVPGAFIAKPMYDGLYKFNLFGADGAGSDTMIFAAAIGADQGPGMPKADSGVFFELKVNAKLSDSGKHICIDSTTNYPPSNTWKWPSIYYTPAYNASPTWSGAQCFVIARMRNAKPDIINCAGADRNGSHCGSFTYDFNATDLEQDAIVWSLVSGVGSIDPSSGVWTANGLATGIHPVVVGATDPGGSGQTATCAFTVTATNVGPTITYCPPTTSVSTGETVNVQIRAKDDCDNISFFLASSTATGATVVELNDSTAVVSYTGNPLDIPNNPVCAVVGVTDGLDTAYCNACFRVILGCKYKISIEREDGGGLGVIQGTMQTIDITLESADQAAGLGGFNLLIAYDNSALSFQSAAAGAIYGICKWEYFTYRFGPEGNCGNGCPSGMIRLIGIAETNNGSPRAICPPNPVPLVTLAQLSFLVSNNRVLECQLVPIRFFWYECGDNTISNADGSKLYVSCSVKDLFGDPISTPEEAFPSYMGAIDDCVTCVPNKACVKREVDFVNGYIKIICGKDIDARGDINLNGQVYEIADAVMFTNYFIIGLPAFVGHADGSIAASDVNADGLTLTVADLVYLIRVIVGDALPYPKPTDLSVNVASDNGTISITGSDLGAVYMTLKGEVTPTLVADDAVMAFAYDGTNTRVLVHVPFDLNHYGMAIKGFSGDIVNADAEIVSIEMADVHGYAVKVALPTEYALMQNYPNPFNPSCKISFAMPVAGDYKITIYNVTGQKVTEMSGNAAAGTKTVEWNAKDNASGVYFYKLETAGFTATKKAVLLK